MASDVLFCPFCRESFEGRSRCPEHELELVPWQALPPDPEAESHGPPAGHVAFYDLRHGRGLVFLGAVLVVLGFGLPVVQTSLSESLEVTGVLLAATRAGNLWTVPFVALAAAALVLRRTTLAGLAGIRLAVASAAVVGFASAGYTTFRLLRTAADVQARYGDAVFVEPRPGAYLVALGLAFVLVGGLRLGRA